MPPPDVDFEALLIRFYYCSDGSYYYSNPNGSTYYNDGAGSASYTAPKGK